MGRRARGREVKELVHADVPMSAQTHGRICLDKLVSAWTHRGVRADTSVLSPSNFITDATVRPSHGRPSGHHLTVSLSVRPLSSVFFRAFVPRLGGLISPSAQGEGQGGERAGPRGRVMLSSARTVKTHPWVKMLPRG
jgi:hypothetical protein